MYNDITFISNIFPSSIKVDTQLSANRLSGMELRERELF